MNGGGAGCKDLWLIGKEHTAGMVTEEGASNSMSSRVAPSSDAFRVYIYVYRISQIYQFIIICFIWLGLSSNNCEQGIFLSGRYYQV